MLFLTASWYVYYRSNNFFPIFFKTLESVTSFRPSPSKTPLHSKNQTEFIGLSVDICYEAHGTCVALTYFTVGHVKFFSSSNITKCFNFCMSLRTVRKVITTLVSSTHLHAGVVHSSLTGQPSGPSCSLHFTNLTQIRDCIRARPWSTQLQSRNYFQDQHSKKSDLVFIVVYVTCQNTRMVQCIKPTVQPVGGGQNNTNTSPILVVVTTHGNLLWTYPKPPTM